LVFIRLLYMQGIEQSQLPEPLAFSSVLSFHDAVELFLVLTGEHLGASLNERLEFMGYWKDLGPSKLPNGVELSVQVGMDRLNRLRKNFKHVGALPGLAAIEQVRADVTTFFDDNTPRVFGVFFGVST
jgi:hypothetical protein